MNKFMIYAALAALTPATTLAQDLHKEIEVDQSITPEKRDAVRINVLPFLQLPSVAKPTLSFSDRVVTAPVRNTISTLEPVAWGTDLTSSPWRGYLNLGVSSTKIGGAASAGYGLVSTARTRLGVWGNYCGDLYRQQGILWRDHSASGGLRLYQRIDEKTRLDAEASYTWAYHNVPVTNGKELGQHSNRADLWALISRGSALSGWDMGVNVGYFGYHDRKLPLGLKPASQLTAGVTFNGRVNGSEVSDFSVEGSYDFIHTSAASTPQSAAAGIISAIGADNQSILGVTPSYTYATPTVKLRLGATVYLRTGCDHLLDLAPSASATWAPNQLIGFEVKATGTNKAHTLASLQAITPLLNAGLTYQEPLHVPLDLEARATLGPVFGTWLQLHGGYAKAENCLMPVRSEDMGYGAVFECTDLAGWRAGVTLGYEYRRLASLRVDWTTVIGDDDPTKGYYRFHDRARQVIDAKLTVTPVERFSATVGWEFRSKRRIYSYTQGEISDLGYTYYTPVAHSLGVISDLRLGLSCQATKALTVWAEGRNLLGRRYLDLGDRPSRPTSVIVGASLKF